MQIALRPRMLARPEMASAWPETALVAGLLLVAGVVLPRAPLSHDIAWQLWLGRQMAHGVPLYGQLNEINPPLWFWLSAGLVRLAEASGASPIAALCGFFLGAAVVSFGLLARMLEGRAPRERAWIYGVAVLASLVIVLREFGQREQYLLLAMLPYAALIARRAEGPPVPARLAAAVSLFAATGLALKPYFAAAPLFLEAWLAMAARGSWRLRRPEWVVLPAAGLLYAAAVVLFAPGYLGVTIPMEGLTYAAYNLSFGDMLQTELGPAAILAAAGFALAAPLRSRLAGAFLAAGAAFALVFFVQAKGWFYQSIPATGFLSLAIATEISQLTWSGLALRRKAGVVLLGCAFVWPLLIFTALGMWSYHNRFRPSVLAAMSDLPPGTTVMALSGRATVIWPMVEERGFVWPSRYYTFWMLPAIARDRAGGHPSPDLQRMARNVQAETLVDLTCRPPARILVHDPRAEDRDRTAFGNPSFDYLAFFREDPRLASFLARYSPKVRNGWLTLDLIDARGIRPAGPCRPIY